MIEATEIKRLLKSHKNEVEQWLNLDISSQVQLLNEVAQGKYEPFDNTVYDLVDEAHDNIMSMLFTNAWNGEAVDDHFWSTDMGQTLMNVRLWLDGDELITITEACEILYGSSTKTDLRRIITLRKNGTLNEYIDVSEPNPTKNTRLSRMEVEQEANSSNVNSAKPFVWNGVEYPSRAAAARALKVDEAVIYYRARNNIHSDDELQHDNKPKTVTWNGVEYPSIRQAARSNGLSYATMKYRISRGYTSDEDMKRQ